MVLGIAAIFGSAIGQHAQKLDAFFIEEGDDAVVQKIGERRLAVVELGEGDFRVGIDEGLLIDAPVDGTVQQLAVHTEGGIVTPAQPLMSVVPGDSRLEIEAMISNRDIGFVHEGQDVEIKIDTFNFTKYGLRHGHVQSVSHDLQREKPVNKSDNQRHTGDESDTSEPAGQELVYVARISLDTQMQIDDRLVDLEPGMAITAEIKTGSRHVISYLLSPLLRHKQQALRER